MDIVTRLREMADLYVETSGFDNDPDAEMINHAAELIEALTAALAMADETFRDLGWHDKWEATSAALSLTTPQEKP